MASYGGQYIDGFMKKPKPYGDYEDPNEDPYSKPDEDFDPFNAGTAQPPVDPTRQTDPEATTEQPPVPSAKPPVDNSAWDTDGYSRPGYTAENYGEAPSGWDPAKWKNANHQTPKYVVGRIIQSAGDMKIPDNRAKAIKMIQDAYPGTTFNGKDTVDIPGVGKVDIFGGAGAGIYSTAWQPLSGVGIGSFSGSGSGGYPALPKSATPETTAAKYNSLLRQFMLRMQGNK